MKKKLIHCNSRVNATVSTKRMYCGKVGGVDIYTDFTVIENTCHLILDSVMNGGLYTSAACMELANELMVSNRRLPAPLSHPTDESGGFISALDPITFTAHNVCAFDTDWRLDGDKLKSNTYVDMSRLAENKEAQWLVDAINNKTPIDRSTGLELLVHDEEGIGPDGEPYFWVVDKICNLDHSALLDPKKEPGAKGNREAVGMFTNAAGEQVSVSEVELTVNASTPAMRLPIGERSIQWDGAAAEQRIREYTNSTAKPSSNYRKFFMYFDQENADEFTAYKLPFADIIDGSPVCVPAAISAIKGALSGSRDGVDIPELDRQRIQHAVDYYQNRIDKEQPQSNFNAMINKITEVFGIKPKSGYNTNVVNNQTEADPMKEKIIAALNAKGIPTDGLTDDALFAAYNEAMKKKCDMTPEEMAKMKTEEDEEKAKGKPAAAANADDALAKILDIVSKQNSKIDDLQTAINASAQKEIDALAADVVALGIGITANTAKAMPKVELEALLAANGHIVANSFGRMQNNASDKLTYQMPE